jgi:hypothetical protein
VDEIEAEVFGGTPDVTQRVYELSREVIEFQRAVRPLDAILGGLTVGFEKYGIGEELRGYLRDVQDHAIEVAERVEGLRQLLQNILSVNLALVSVQQNEERSSGSRRSAYSKMTRQKGGRLGGDPVRPDPERQRLRDELRAHAGAALGARLPVRALADGAGVRVALRNLQETRLALRRFIRSTT